MTRRPTIWLVLALLFLAVNFFGGIYAAVMREGPHAGLHAALTLLGAYLVFRLLGARRTDPGAEADAAPAPPVLGERLAHLEQSVDAIAVEVERVGEGQRYMQRLLVEDEAPPAKTS